MKVKNFLLFTSKCFKEIPFKSVSGKIEKSLCEKWAFNDNFLYGGMIDCWKKNHFLNSLVGFKIEDLNFIKNFSLNIKEEF